MRKSRFTEAQIIGVLKEAEAGAKGSELCRRHGITETTFYRWRKNDPSSRERLRTAVV